MVPHAKPAYNVDRVPPCGKATPRSAGQQDKLFAFSSPDVFSAVSGHDRTGFLHRRTNAKAVYCLGGTGKESKSPSKGGQVRDGNKGGEVNSPLQGRQPEGRRYGIHTGALGAAGVSAVLGCRLGRKGVESQQIC
jgi:hypothetical protein